MATLALFLAASVLWLGACGPAPDVPHAEDASEATGAASGEAPGHWSAGGRLALTAEQRAEIERLEAIGYAQGTREVQGTGVTRHDPARAHPGRNLVTSGHGPEAVLIDMQGNALHRWSLAFEEIWPGREPSRPTSSEFWRHVHAYPNGDLLVIFEGLGIARLDRASRLLWANDLGAHHDLAPLPGGEVLVLERRASVLPRIDPSEPVLEDFVTWLGADGRVRQRLSLLEAFERSEQRELLDSRRRRTGDIFHTNTLHRIGPSAVEESLPHLRPGNLLLSMNAMSTLAVLDFHAGRILWARRMDYRGLHDVQLLGSGSLLLFENRAHQGASRAAELDPVTLETRWSHPEAGSGPLFSHCCGKVARLPNGNTLITESEGGRALEVTPDGDTVWEFFNPHRAGARAELIATLFELERLPEDFGAGWIEGTGAPR